MNQRVNSESAAVTKEEEKDDEEEFMQILPTRKMCSRLSAAIVKITVEFCISFRTAGVSSNLAAKEHHQLASQQDICTAEEDDASYSISESVLCSHDLQHPLVYDIYNVCT